MSTPKTLTQLFGLNTVRELETATQIVEGRAADQFIRAAVIEPFADGVLKNSVLYNAYKESIGQDSEYVKLIKVDKSSVSFLDNSITNLIIPQPATRAFDSSIIQCRSGVAQPRTRHVNELNLFLNSLPSYIPSMLVPYLDVEFDVPRPDSAEGRRTAPTLTRFIMGNKIEGNDQIMVDASSNKNVEKTSRVFVGMEVFTSPQTLVNPNINKEGGLKNEILDPFRPFMTLESAEISVQPEVGFFTKKRAKLSLKLHDRSRLSEISDMIRPQTYTGTNIWLTYGWIYPTQNGRTDPYGEFINSTMLVKECYGIVNCSYSFDQHGQASINLELFTKSITELRNLNTDQLLDTSNLEFTKKSRAVIAELDKLLEGSTLSPEAKDKLKEFQRGTNTKEMRIFQILHAAERQEVPDVKDAEAAALITNLQKVLNPNKKTPDNKQRAPLLPLQQSLDAYLKVFKDKDKLRKSLSSAADNGVGAYFKHLDDLRKNSKSGDYFLENIPKDHPIRERLQSQFKSIGKDKIISFGTLVSNIILSSVGKINEADKVECQIIFYNFNSSCSNLSKLNISEFPIQFEEFKKQLKEELITTKMQTMSIEQLIKFIVTHQIEDPRHLTSELREYYDPVSSEPLVANVKKDKQNLYATKLDKARENRGIYKVPVVECMVEALSLSDAQGLRQNNSTNTVNLLDKINSKPTRFTSSYGTMLRFHIFDKQLSAYPEIEEYEAKTVRETNGTGIEIKVAGAGLKPKDIITKNIPSVIFGGNATTVISATVASQHEPLLSSVQMLKPVMKPTNIQPNGSDAGGLPLRVIPSTLNTTMLGCPLLFPAQSLYFDFQTGTTLDNVYVLTHLTHHIGPGKFQSVCQFTPHDGYGQYESLVGTLKEMDTKVKLLNTTR